MQAADFSVVTPLIYSPEYIPFLINYCKDNNISLVIPLFDIDLPVLADNIDKFNAVNTRVLVSDYDFVKTCNDKYLAYNFLKANNFNTVPYFIDLVEAENALESGLMNYPVVIKPRWGMGSIAIYKADNLEELRVLYKKTLNDIHDSYLKYESSADFQHSVLIQQLITGQEYGADIIHDFDGKFRACVIREKIAMRSGETDCAKIVDNALIHDTLIKLSGITKHIGNLDLDILMNDSGVYILEMNARFGGGYPFSHEAGVNLPEALIKWITGQEINDDILRAKTGITAYKDIVIKKQHDE